MSVAPCRIGPVNTLDLPQPTLNVTIAPNGRKPGRSISKLPIGREFQPAMLIGPLLDIAAAIFGKLLISLALPAGIEPVFQP
jgi:hypothetical protein